MTTYPAYRLTRKTASKASIPPPKGDKERVHGGDAEKQYLDADARLETYRILHETLLVDYIVSPEPVHVL